MFSIAPSKVQDTINITNNTITINGCQPYARLTIRRFADARDPAPVGTHPATVAVNRVTQTVKNFVTHAGDKPERRS